MVGEHEVEDPVLAAILESEVGLVSDGWDADAVFTRWVVLPCYCNSPRQWALHISAVVPNPRICRVGLGIANDEAC